MRWVLSRRRSRRSRISISYCGQPWLTSVPSVAPMKAAIDGSVRIDWAGITKGNFERCALSTLDRVTVGCRRRARQPTGGCIAVEKLSRVELLEGAWHTAPNPSRPQTCVAEVDVDAED